MEKSWEKTGEKLNKMNQTALLGLPFTVPFVGGAYMRLREMVSQEDSSQFFSEGFGWDEVAFGGAFGFTVLEIIAALYLFSAYKARPI